MVAISGSWGKLAPSLVAYVLEANRLAPGRSTASDGSIGDSSHAARPSDHNPAHGVVHAVDLTHDPAGGWDAHARLEELRVRRDPRVKYGISRRRTFSPPSWQWVPYFGENPHEHHAHLSILDTPAAEDDVSPWFPAVAPPPPVPPSEEDDMLLVVTDKAVYLIGAGDGPIRLGGPQFTELAAQGVKAVHLGSDAGQLAAFGVPE